MLLCQTEQRYADSSKNLTRQGQLQIRKKPRVNKRVLTEEKLDEIAFRLEISPRKSLRRLAQEVGVSKTSVQHATKLLKLKPYKTRVVHQLLPADDAVPGHMAFSLFALKYVDKTYAKRSLVATDFLGLWIIRARISAITAAVRTEGVAYQNA
ncbi:hypothetical protein C0J52_21885 [Blattella germanica]|nr:hypothetical protein C0J52_21885 [Blattella germanica]